MPSTPASPRPPPSPGDHVRHARSGLRQHVPHFGGVAFPVAVTSTLPPFSPSNRRVGNRGLAVWCKTAGFEVLKVGQFGNEQELSNMYKSPTWWPKTHSYFNETRRPQIINDPWVPIDVWVLARRPLWKL